MPSTAPVPTRARMVGYHGLVAFAVPSCAIVLHELGHFIAHAAYGYAHNSLSYDGVVAFELLRAGVGTFVAVSQRGFGALWGGLGELRYVAQAFTDAVAPAALLAIVELGIPIVGAVVTLRRLPRDARLAVGAVALAGSAAGVGVWIGWLGPTLLP